MWGKAPECETWDAPGVRNLSTCQECWNTALDKGGKERAEKGHGILPALQPSEPSIQRLHGPKDFFAAARRQRLPRAARLLLRVNLCSFLPVP
jgi:hypothetical protein